MIFEVPYTVMRAFKSSLGHYHYCSQALVNPCFWLCHILGLSCLTVLWLLPIIMDSRSYFPSSAPKKATLSLRREKCSPKQKSRLLLFNQIIYWGKDHTARRFCPLQRFCLQSSPCSPERAKVCSTVVSPVYTAPTTPK